MPFVKITLSDGEVQVINTDHIIRVLKMGDKVELEMVGGFGIHNFPPQRYAELMIELGVASKPIHTSSYVRDEPVL